MTVGSTYTFSFWIKSVSTSVTNLSTQADIGIQINNASILSSPSSTLAPLPANGWVKMVYEFKPTNACVNIELWNNNTNPVGNDFAVDDFELFPPPEPLDIAYTISNLSCPGAKDGAIAVYGVGGIKPYKNFTLSGSASSSNSSGLFKNLSPGTYSVSVTDQNNATKSIGSLIVTEPTDISVGSGSSICKGASVQLSASNGIDYNWSSNPADPSLTTPTVANPTVSPTQTTVYTVTSLTSTSKELIFNGDFSQGNVGFSSDYKYLNPVNQNGIQRAYGIVTNPSGWFNTFGNCPGSNMMVVDGSTFNSGNDKVWSQTVAVIPGQTYEFSYYIQSVVATNLANIEVYINGVRIGSSLA
ncbi:MAG: hypothetical protein FGM46_07570, partial [Ferruginibacter sp.]|nr:hypothetical protein [Ferruginibacter sp.]